jgi:hypothetical protein
MPHADLHFYFVPANSRGSAGDRELFELRRGNDLTTEAAWLGQIARAYMRSPVA